MNFPKSFDVNVRVLLEIVGVTINNLSSLPLISWCDVKKLLSFVNWLVNVGIVVVEGNAPTSDAVYVGLVYCNAQEGTFGICVSDGKAPTS